ncbi:MAG: S8 family serine peptidase, partial [Salinibacter sp.]
KAHSQGIPPGIERVNADQAANIDSVDQRVDADIAILDTGVDPTHPDIDVVRFKNCVGNRNTDGDGHGTHVAGTAAAIDNGQGVVGVAPGARIWSVKVLDDSGSGTFGTTGTVVCGIDFVTQHADQIDVANMSLGGRGFDVPQHNAIISSAQEGVFYAVAAGNSARDIFGANNCFDENPACPLDTNATPGIQQDEFDNFDTIPAAYPEVATVSAMSDVDGERGAIGSPGAADDVFAGFTNFSGSNAALNPFSPFGPNPVTSPGAAIDVAAPGSDVLSTYKQAGLDVLSGTSMASPHVAGAAALYIAENGRDVNGDGTVNAQDVFAVRQALVDSGQPQSNWQSGSTGDPDANPEPLVQVGSFSPSLTTSPCPSDQTQPSQDVTVGTDLECPAQNR